MGQEDEKPREPYSAIKEMLKSWERFSANVERYLPDNAVAVRSTNLLNQNVISHFKDIFKMRRKQLSMDRFVVRRTFKPKVSKSEPSVQPEVVESSTSHGDKEKEKKLKEKVLKMQVLTFIKGGLRFFLVHLA